MLAFGIVTIPIHMMAAVRDHAVHFHQISRTNRKRIRYKKVAEGSDDEVDPADIVKGFAVKEGHYVVFDDEELAQLGARKSRVSPSDSRAHTKWGGVRATGSR